MVFFYQKLKSFGELFFCVNNLSKLKVVRFTLLIVFLTTYYRQLYIIWKDHSSIIFLFVSARDYILYLLFYYNFVWTILWTITKITYCCPRSKWNWRANAIPVAAAYVPQSATGTHIEDGSITLKEVKRRQNPPFLIRIQITAITISSSSVSC